MAECKGVPLKRVNKTPLQVEIDIELNFQISYSFSGDKLIKSLSNTRPRSTNVSTVKL